MQLLLFAVSKANTTEYGARRACQLRPRCVGPERAQTQHYSIVWQISPVMHMDTYIKNYTF